MERPIETLAQRVKKVRKELKLSQAKLAELSGLRQPDISKIELGLIEKTTGIARLASALKVSSHWLETGEGSPEMIVIDGGHRLYSQLKNLDLNKVMIESLNLDAFVAAERTIEERPTDEEVDLLKAFRKLPKDDRADLVRDLKKRAEAIDEMVRRYLLEHPPASGTPATRTRPSGAGERRHQTAAPGATREKYIARTSRRSSSNRGSK